VVLNDYYVEVPTRAMSVGFSRHGFTEYQEGQTACSECPQHRAQIILDFQVCDVDAEYPRIAGLGVDWLTPPNNPTLGKPQHDLPGPRGKSHQRLLARRGRPQLARPAAALR
jgi:hypothetical protein